MPVLGGVQRQARPGAAGRRLAARRGAASVPFSPEKIGPSTAPGISSGMKAMACASAGFKETTNP